MNLIRPALALMLATTLCASGLPASAAPSHTRGAAGPGLAEAATPVSAETTPNVADNTLIVRLKGGATAAALARVYAAADTSAGAVSVVRGDVLSWKIPAGETVTGFAEKLEDTGGVMYAEPNYLRQLAGYTPPAYVEPNDPAFTDAATWGTADGETPKERYPFAKSWWIRDINGIAAWRRGYTGPDVRGKYPLRSGGTGFKVAVIDTGFYTGHPDKSANIVAGSADITPASPNEAPGLTAKERVSTVAHGTCTAGIVGAAVNNGKGTLGLGNDTRVAVYKVYFGGQGIADSVIIAAIRKAADDGCRVINMSLAGGDYNAALQDAINYAWGRGCVLVAATGNEGRASVSYPAAMEHVVAVGAIALDESGQRKRAGYSNFGTKLDISAPGSWIWGLTQPGYTEDQYASAGYTWWDGTSMASPMVAGGIALLWRAMPNLSNQEIVDLVQGTASDLGAVGRDDMFGSGELDLAAAYNRLTSDYPLLGKPEASVSAASDGLSAGVSWTAVPGYGVSYDVSVDGDVLASGLMTTAATVSLAPRVRSLVYRRGQLTWSHTPTDGHHEIAVTPRSPRNWADGTEVAVRPVTVPGTAPHVDSLTIDGVPVSVADNGLTGSLSTAGLALGQHQAVMRITDNLGHTSEPLTLVFTVRPSPTIRRITGTDQYSFATAASRRAFPAATTAVLVSGASWADALSAAPLAHAVAGPVLLTTRNSLPRTTRTELARLKVKRIIIVGDTKDVSSKVKKSLSKRYRSVSRISGGDRYATANAVARALAKRTRGRVADGKVVVVGDNYTDGVAASAVAARMGWPLLFTRRGSIPLPTRKTITAIHATSTLVVGDGTRVSIAARRQLRSSTRVAGGSILSDPTMLATWAITHYPTKFSGERIYLASSSKWTNGLGLPSAAAHEGALVLATKSSLASPVRSYYLVNSEVAVTTRIVGSTKTITSSAANTLKGIVGAP